jgi:hypothetical protein
MLFKLKLSSVVQACLRTFIFHVKTWMLQECPSVKTKEHVRLTDLV